MPNRSVIQSEREESGGYPRRASWLHSDYSADKWDCTDEDGGVYTLDFAYRMPDGTALPDWPEFYQLVKEFAWWARDEEYGCLSDGLTHKSRVMGLMAVSHSFALNGLHSFGHVLPSHIEPLVRQSAEGISGVLRASERVVAQLAKVAQSVAGSPPPLKGLTRYVLPSGEETDKVDSRRILAGAGLPDAVSRVARVMRPIAVVARSVGLRAHVGVVTNAPERITAHAMTRFLQPLQYIYELRERIDAVSLAFNPFPDGIYPAVKPYGEKVNRTPTPSPSAALGLLQQAMVWVVEYGDTIVRLEQQCHAMPDGTTIGERHETESIASITLPGEGLPGSPWPCVLTDSFAESDLTLRRVVKLLAAACWIVIATFSARRAIEIRRLPMDGLSGSDSDGWWLQMYIAKTLQRYEPIPVPHVVARAVGLLLRLSGRAREAGAKSIFSWVSPFPGKGAKRAIYLHPAKWLDAFAHHVSGAMTPEARNLTLDWHWTSHQFRRFFAVLYFYRYEEASLEVLSHHLRHFNLEMTRVYVTRDLQNQAFWLDAEWAYVGDLARSVVAQERRLGGPMGDRLAKFARRVQAALRRKLVVVLPDHANDYIRRFMTRAGLVLTPRAWATCTCPTTARGAAAANCRPQGDKDRCAVGPDGAGASPSACANCPWGISTPSTRRFVQEERKVLEAAVHSTEGSSSVVDVLARARLFELQRASHWETLDDDEG